MNKLFFSILVTLACVTTDSQATKKRRNRDSNSNSAQKLVPVKTEPEEVLELFTLPSDILYHLLLHVIRQSRTAEEAGLNVKSCLSANKASLSLLSNQDYTGKLIKQIAKRFTIPVFKAAIALATFTSTEFLIKYLAQVDNVKEKKAIGTYMHESNAKETFYLLRCRASLSNHIINRTLHRFTHAGNQAVIQKLLGLGADINSLDGVNRSPIMYAINLKHITIVTLLLFAHAQVNVRDIYGDTPLHWAASTGPTEVVQMLLQHGASVNIANNHEETPLMNAVTKNKIEIVQTLLDADADVFAQNTYLQTAYDIAVSKQNHSIIALLKQYIDYRI